MAKLPTTEILPQELEDLFQALDVWTKIRSGILSSQPKLGTQKPSWGYPGGISEIVKHENGAGYHAVTTHRVVMPDGSIPHWDAKDIRMGEITLWCPSG